MDMAWSVRDPRITSLCLKSSPIQDYLVVPLDGPSLHCPGVNELYQLPMSL